MPRKSDAGGQLVQQLLAGFAKLPLSAKAAVVGVVLVAGVTLYFANRPAAPAAVPEGTVTLCVWNMENLFDDKDDRLGTVDEGYDTWFVEKPDDRKAKYDKLAGWLVKQNGGKGPDVVVGIEIESLRAAELLRDALNAALASGATKYEHVAMKEVAAGRHIAPCVVSRYPLSDARLPDRVRRILEVRVTANGHELLLVAAHWTSQKTDKGDTEGGGRAKYAAAIHESYARALKANPKLDYLVCGDFNESPTGEVVANKLHLTGDAKLVTADADPPRLFGPLSGKDPAEFGTHYFDGPLIYDQVGFSPGMLDAAGWSYVPDSVKVPTDGLIRGGAKTRRPWRFGSRNDDAVGRGYSDHFPVLVTLRVAP